MSYKLERTTNNNKKQDNRSKNKFYMLQSGNYNIQPCSAVQIKIIIGNNEEKKKRYLKFETNRYLIMVKR